MIFTSDGKAFVYGVFSADGCECEFLEALFGDEKSARQHLRKLRSAKTPSGTPTIYGRAEFASVRMIEVQETGLAPSGY